MKKTPYICPNF